MPKIISLDKKEIIYKEYSYGLSTRAIARMLKISDTSVQRILRNFGFRNLKENGYKRRIQKHVLDLSNFKNKEFSDYWAGFIAADGCIYNKKGQKRLVINLSIIDKKHLEKFNIGYPITNGSRNSCVLDVPSDFLCNYLKDKYNIIERKTLTLIYPIDLKNHNHFIRGYFDGDGCFHLSEGKYLTANIVGNLNFLETLKEILPCKSSIYKIKRSKVYQLIISQKPKEMLRFCNFLYNDSTIYLERKQIYLKYLRT